MEAPLPLSALRLVDANLNRATEGLRVLEDLARFVLDEVEICAAYKTLRHQLTFEVDAITGPERYRARDVDGDVGTEVTTVTEGVRTDLSAIAKAAASRLEQSLRCLEECAKLASSTIGARIEQIRYQAYQVNAQLLLMLERDAEFLKKARLYVLADCALPLDAFVVRIVELSKSGVDLIQIRDKSADAAKLIEYANAASTAIDPAACRLIMNDRCDVAACCSVFGLHLGQTDIPIERARRLLPVKQVIGLSTHCPEQYQSAKRSEADYIGCGPTFVSQTKSFEAYAGLDYLRFVAEQDDALPAFAIGGISVDNIDQVLNVGFHRVAVASAIWNAANPVEAAESLKEKLS